MERRHPELDAAMDRLLAEITLLTERARASESVLEERACQMLLAETAIADHRYRVARDEHLRLRRCLAEAQSDLGSLILEREIESGAFVPAPRGY